MWPSGSQDDQRACKGQVNHWQQDTFDSHLPKIRLIDTESRHGVNIRHARKRSHGFDADPILPHFHHQLFDDILDLGLRGERHLEVDLRELGLTVPSASFVAVTSCDLKVSGCIVQCDGGEPQ